jgi:AcrR family transcriptional regulator
MAVTHTARERARAELTLEIKDEARRELAQVGANGLSLRAVARELGMVSSALYRYFPSRDHLLTALIIDAYDAMGHAVQAAHSPGDDPRRSWQAVWHAARNWARQHPHEYALIYGSPIPGYRAPQDTIAPAGRVALTLTEQLTRVAGTLEAEVPVATLNRLLIAWTQLFGTISFELFGQFVGSVDPTDSFFACTTQQMADFVGIT